MGPWEITMMWEYLALAFLLLIVPLIVLLMA